METPRSKALKLAKKTVHLKEGWTKHDLPKAKRIEGGGTGFSYKDLKHGTNKK